MNNKLITINHILLCFCWIALLVGLSLTTLLSQLRFLMFAILIPPFRYFGIPIFPKRKELMIEQRVDKIIPFSLSITFFNKNTSILIIKWLYRILGVIILLLMLIYNGYVMLWLDTKYYSFGTPINLHQLYDDDLIQLSKQCHLLPKELQKLQALRDEHSQTAQNQFQQDINFIMKFNNISRTTPLGIYFDDNKHCKHK